MKPKYFSIAMYPTVSFKQEEILGRLLMCLNQMKNLLLLIGVAVKQYR